MPTTIEKLKFKKRVKKQPTEWKKLFVNNIFDQCLTEIIIFYNSRTTITKTNVHDSLEKLADDLNKHLSKKICKCLISTGKYVKYEE